MDLVGKVLAKRYEIREEVGKGGMARVYKAWCHLLNRYVAIKVLKEEYKDDKEFVHRFHVEAQAAAGISNPHVVSIYDVGIENGLYYIVMEYIEGITLKEYIAEKGSLPWQEAASFAAQICEGLAAAHKANVVHRDIKPQNIIMTREGILKVTDFGIARASGQATMTMGGNAIGTVHYLSPEQARGGYTDQRTDIYSLGVVLYEMLTGELPFVDESPVAVAIKHIQEAPRPLREVNPDIPAAMEAVTLRAMKKEQGARYADAEAFLADINRVLQDPESRFAGKRLADLTGDEDEMGSTIKMGSIDDDTIHRYEEEQKRKKTAPRTGRRAGGGAVKETEERELREIDERRTMREQKKKEQRITWIAILAAVLVVTILGVAFSAMTGGFTLFAGGAQVQIPDLVDMDLEKAREDYKDKFNIVRQSEKQDDKEAGTILEQKPAAGDKVSKRDDIVIYVVVSAGNNASNLQSYVGMDVESAKKALEDAGFQTNVVEEKHDTEEKGKIFAQNPKEGDLVAKGSLVTLYVSKGNEEPEPSAEPTQNPTETENPTETSKPEPTNTTTPTKNPVQTPKPTQPSEAPGIGD